MTLLFHFELNKLESYLATDESGVQAGDTFGVYNIGIRPVPIGVGSANWFIFANMNGNEFVSFPNRSRPYAVELHWCCWHSFALA